jgi:plastocyanin
MCYLAGGQLMRLTVRPRSGKISAAGRGSGGVPQLTSRAGGWDEQRLADQKEEPNFPRDTGRGTRWPGLWALILALVAAALLFVACGDDNGTSSPTPAISVSSGDEGDELVELQLTAKDTRFDKDRLQAPAASEVSVTLDNRDSTEHNFSLYESAGSTAPIFTGELFAGPSFLTYQFPAPEPGTYRFQCDVHPDVMAGQFIVE